MFSRSSAAATRNLAVVNGSLYRLRQTCPRGTRIALVRGLSQSQTQSLSSSAILSARKDAQDKDSLKPEPTEYSKSGSDAQAAQTEEAAFDPQKTSPETEKGTAGSEANDSNPLEVSPANQEVSKPRGSTEGGPEGSAPGGRERASGGGSPKKHGKTPAS
ncbi:hypothetical protein L228DRAFT_284168 [Xylona heveae TC161]|uniref:Uncharacterized protein n=1 Tax=Xylona heveae (strain CBS 132557 / TC161) TaxID=1328760 RepID=A0A165FKY0_XYLHT|nr:hypothetical protein L228DRAFT_284168 [Xylona heveae TC161]KZF21096.1 hypothetical protein L228DRAFT_284168 [Xylona heveae TC161]